MSDSDFWQAIQFVHVVSMAFFVGGQIVVAAAVVPVLRREPERTRMRAIARRFGIGSLVAVALLVATGVAMAEHYSLWSSGTLQLKLGLVVLVAALTGAHIFLPRSHAISAVILLVSLAIVWLGLEIAH